MTDASAATTPLSRLLRAVLPRWRFLGALTIGIALVTAAVTLLLPNQYTAQVVFLPEFRPAEGLPPNIAGIAAQFGVSVSSEPSQSPQFYADLVKSRSLLDRLIREQYAGSPGGKARFRQAGVVADLLRVPGRTDAERMEWGRDMVAAATAVAVDRRTGVIRLGFRSEDPAFAAWAANALVGYVGDFNLRTRQSQARAQRSFAETRAQDAGRVLNDAENVLRAFYDENRLWELSPRLRFEEGRLRRRVEIQSEVYVSLLRQVESSRVAEVNNLPVITVIDPAIAPTRKSGPLRRAMVLLSAFAAFALGVGLVLLREFAPEIRREVPELWDAGSRLAGRLRRR